MRCVPPTSITQLLDQIWNLEYRLMQTQNITIVMLEPSRMALQIRSSLIGGGCRLPVTCFTLFHRFRPPTTWGIRTTPSSPAGCWQRTMASLLSSSTSAPGSVFAMQPSIMLKDVVPNLSLPSVWIHLNMPSPSHPCRQKNSPLHLQDTAQGPRSNLKDTALISWEFSTWSSEALCSALRLTWVDPSTNKTAGLAGQSWGSCLRACTDWSPFCRMFLAKIPDRQILLENQPKLLVTSIS